VDANTSNTDFFKEEEPPVLPSIHFSVIEQEGSHNSEHGIQKVIVLKKTIQPPSLSMEKRESSESIETNMALSREHF